MKKKVVIATLAIIALLAIGLNITGLVTNEDGETTEPAVNVTRHPIIKNETANTTIIRLGIVSSENILAIKETIVPEGCEILDTYSEPKIDILELNKNEQTWIIANRLGTEILPGDTNGDSKVDILDYRILKSDFGSCGENLSSDFNNDGCVNLEDFAILRGNFGTKGTLNIDLYYSLPYNCGINEGGGTVYILSENDQLTSNIIEGQDEQTSTNINETPETTSGGGSSSGSTSTAGLQAIPIQQAETETEFNEMIKESIKNILRLDESEEVDTSSIIIWIILAIAILIIIIVLIYLIFKKPHDFPQKTKKQLKHSNVTKK